MLNNNHSSSSSIPLNTSSYEKNDVIVAGKVSQVGLLRYSPSGVPLGEMVLAVKQSHLELTNMGYFDVLLTGELAERWFSRLKIGTKLEVGGQLWSRAYKNRQGLSLKETKILARTLNEIS